MRALLSFTLAAIFLLPSVANARLADNYRYRYRNVWNAALRMVRVDYGFKVHEKDADAGFLVFDYESHGRSYPASIEVIELDGEVKVIAKVPKMPSYIERMLLDRLEKKLRADYGLPQVRERKKKEVEEPADKPAPPENDKKDAVAKE